MTGPDDGIASFGPFRLSPATRQLERDGVPLALGDRALDILIVLVEHAGEIVSHRDLITRVWRGLVVTPGNLRVHMTALRKALGDGTDETRYIENVVGQGYCFVAPVTLTKTATRTTPALPSAASTTAQLRGLPPVLTRMVGREDVVRTIVADLWTDRFVTIVGPGGVGKTTVAVCVAHAMLDEFSGNVCFVDIGAITDPGLLATTVASTLGLTNQSPDTLATLMSSLQSERLLLVLDNCEHVIDAAASLAELIFSQAPKVHILATSREALRVEGEHAHWLRPLANPPDDAPVDAQAALTFPAIKLFVERAVAGDNRFELTDANAPIVAGLCRRLDGVALAIEFVAGRVGIYGLQGTADLLDKRLGLHWQGRRTALPRHKTLHALLDWSYELLPESEQRALRRFGIFVGPFKLEAAHAVASAGSSADEWDEAGLASAVDSLIAKSLVSTYETLEGGTSYRLLETTRIYALEQLEEAGETESTAERHARYFAGWLSKAAEAARSHHEQLGNLRAALEWCFDNRSGTSPAKTELGVELAAAAVATLLHFSLWTECLTWSKAALARLPDSTCGGRRELVLREALAISSMYTGAADVRPAILRGIEIAHQLSETTIHLRLLASLHFLSHRVTDFHASLAISEEIGAVARTTDDVILWAISDWLQGSSQYCLGNQAAALQLFERGFTHGGDHYTASARQLGIYYRSRGLTGRARVQWLCGYPDRALQTARQALAESAETALVNRSYTLLIVCHVFLWRGDLNTAWDVIEKVMAQPHWQGRLVWFHTEALALKGEVLLRRGDLAKGIELLRTALNDMKTKNQKNLMLTVTACALAEGLAAAGHLEEALAVITDTLAHPPGNAETWEAPELLRVRANILLSMPQSDEGDAERCLLHSLALARRQCAKGWELRTTTTLAQLRARQGRDAEAREVLANLYAQFTEGFDTRDLKAAERLLAELDRRITSEERAIDLSVATPSDARTIPSAAT
ncbi:ATP-binding protein [Povalibacter sp.]|uniref:ATP-binding protein n=1 Tax=Povalibacter sp. TaxID=1962978 RepID=UPI002F407651